jgi:ectoine hydroxylase-related dioxygenase (phytanoyl-CoA dioxygenase family)
MNLPDDLAEAHEPVSDLFPRMAGPEDRERYALSEEQIAFFREHGYVSGIPMLSDDQVDALRTELDGFFRPDHGGRELWYEYHSNESAEPDTVLFHALGAWRIAPGFHDLLWHQAFTVPASQLLEGSVRFWHDQLFCKPARDGGVVAWHQDYSYWTRTQPMQHLTCWIGLDDSTVENGCLQYVPGSHTWDLLPITGLAGDMEAIRKVLSEEQWEQLNNPVAIELKKGECAFHHPLLVHGSFGNTSDRPRRAVVLNTVRDGVCSLDDAPLLAGVPPIVKGAPLDGRFFPLLFDT